MYKRHRAVRGMLYGDLRQAARQDDQINQAAEIVKFCSELLQTSTRLGEDQITQVLALLKQVGNVLIQEPVSTTLNVTVCSDQDNEVDEVRSALDLTPGDDPCLIHSFLRSTILPLNASMGVLLYEGPVWLNGIKLSLTILIDTGAEMCFYSEEIISQLHPQIRQLCETTNRYGDSVGVTNMNSVVQTQS